MGERSIVIFLIFYLAKVNKMEAYGIIIMIERTLIFYLARVIIGSFIHHIYGYYEVIV
jgi:hypothetical protein